MILKANKSVGSKHLNCNVEQYSMRILINAGCLLFALRYSSLTSCCLKRGLLTSLEGISLVLLCLHGKEHGFKPQQSKHSQQE